MSDASKAFAKMFKRNVNIGNGVIFNGMYTAKEFKSITCLAGINIPEPSELNCYAFFTTEPSKLEGMKYSGNVITPDLFSMPSAVIMQINEYAISKIGSVTIRSEE